MSRDSCFTVPIHRNENKFENSLNQMPLIPSRAPLNSIPDPSQYQREAQQQQARLDSEEKSELSKDYRRKKTEGIAESQLASAVLKTPKVHGRGKPTNSDPNSAGSTPIRTGHRLSIAGSASSWGLTRLPAQFGNDGGSLSRASRKFSIATPQQLLTDAPHFELGDDPCFWNDHNVQVLIRIRPLNSTEMISQGYGRCLRQESAQTVVWMGQPETRFTFDHIVGERISQEELFRVAGLPMVDNCISGYNSCMFAYGQTGSGKTYTMMGEVDKMDGKLHEDCGITPRIFEYLFSRITKEEENRAHERLAYSCKCSFLEIYNEQITDLLEPSSTNLQLREDLKKGVYVENLTEHSVRTVNDVLQLLQQGAANRKIAATYMNCESSRSHSVFTCIMESRWEKDSLYHLRFGRLNLVDLAGSERSKSSGAEGHRLKEAANINKSLSTLGLVIMSLVDLAEGKHRHVPYRDSRLTFLLQDSLGGNSKTTIIANVSPSICAANETLSTLKFAQRAKLIHHDAKINEDASAGVIALQQQIQQLKDQLSFLLKHLHNPMELLDIVPRQEQSSLGFLSEGYELTKETNMHDEHEIRKGELMKKKYFKYTLQVAVQREKLAETKIKRLKAEITHLNRLAHQQEEEAQHSKTMLKFREEKIERLELLLSDSLSADKFYLDENTALREENLLLQAKIERNPGVIRFAMENNRFQDLYKQGERETLPAEISELGNQELEVSKELEQCRDLNSKLLREVDELQRRLSSRMESSEDNFNSIDNVLGRSDLADEAISRNFPGYEVTHVGNDEKDLPMLLCDDIDKQLVDAQSLIETMKLEKLELIRELQSVKIENQHLMKNLEMNQYSSASVEGTSILYLQAKLEKLSKELKEAHILNKQHIEDHATRLSQNNQTELVRREVEAETTRTIIHLQEEIDRLQSKFHVCLCSMAEENLNLRNSVAAKEDELRVLCEEWERATLELTTFLIDGSRSLGNASCEIKSISTSFPKVNDWINEHVERAAKLSVEKEETILLLQNSLKNAHNTVIQMEEKLHSLMGATIALIEFQQHEKSSRGEEIWMSRTPNDLTEVKELSVHRYTPKKGSIAESQAKTSFSVETRTSDCNTAIPGGNFDGNLPSVCASASATQAVDIQNELASIIAETQNAVNRSCADAETYLSALSYKIHDVVSLSRIFVRDLRKDVNDMRKDIEGLKRNRGKLHFSGNTIPLNLPPRHENQLLILQRVRNELVETNSRLNSMNACFYEVMNMHCDLDSTETDGWTSDCFCSCSSASVQSSDNDEKPSSCDRYRCMATITERTLTLNSDEQSNLTCKRAILLLRKEFRKTYEAFIKLMDHLMVVSAGEANHNCSASLSSISDLHAVEKLNKKGNVVDQSTRKRTQVYIKCYGELPVKEKNQPSSFFATCEEAYAAMQEPDYMLKAMLKSSENANASTAMWKQAGEKLMADNTSLDEEIDQLKSCVCLKNREKEVPQNAILSTLREEADIFSSLEECFTRQTGLEELSATAFRDATKDVEETNICFSSFRSSLEDLMCNAIQNDISIFVLQFQMGEYSHKFRRLNTTLNPEQSILQDHPLVADNLEPSRDHNSVLGSVKCEKERCQVACASTKEIKEFEMVDGDTVDKNSELQRELERKDILLKGLLFDFRLLQEFASHRKDINDELKMLIYATSEVQQELHIKSVQLDDMLVEKTKLECRLSDAEHALFSSFNESNQTKEAINILTEENVALKDFLKDLYLKNSEAEQLLEDRGEAIKSLEREIIRLSSSQEKHSVSSLEDYEDALTQETAERDQLLEKLTSLKDKLDMVSALADENKAIAAEARQESETSKMHAEQKEEEVKILERSVEELESTINVMEKKVLEMEEEVEKQQAIRDSLEVEHQALRERLLTVEGLTESMTFRNSSAGVLEDQFSRKLHRRSLEINEAHIRIRFLEDENDKQAKEVRQFRDYISELVLHAEAQASQYQQKYKTLEAMLNEVKTDITNVSAAPTSERADKISARTRGSSSPFRCIVGLVQQMNQEKDQELSSARLRIDELETLAACRYKEVCVLNTRLATAESMTHDVIRDLLSVKLDISNYANIIEQHQLQRLIEEAEHRRQDFVAMEHEIGNLRSQIDDLLEERERCYSEINRNKANQLAIQIALEQLQERDQFLVTQNDMLKMDKFNLQNRVAELDEMVKKLLSMQDSQPSCIQRRKSSLLGLCEFDISERLGNSQKLMQSSANDCRPVRASCPDNKQNVWGKITKPN